MISSASMSLCLSLTCVCLYTIHPAFFKKLSYLLKCLQTILILCLNIFPKLAHGLAFDMGKVCLCLPSASRSREELRPPALSFGTHMCHGLLFSHVLEIAKETCGVFFLFFISNGWKWINYDVFWSNGCWVLSWRSSKLSLFFNWTLSAFLETKKGFWMLGKLNIRWQHGSMPCFEKLWFFFFWFWGDA